MTEVRELTPGELEAVAGAIIPEGYRGCPEGLRPAYVNCTQTVADAWNAFYAAAGLDKPFP